MDPLFTALTRPTTVLGVPLKWFLLLAGQWGFTIIMWPAFFKAMAMGGGIAMCGWIYGMIRTEKEPFWMEIMWVKLIRNNNNRNHGIWNANSYMP
jgi:type IV secretory pathway VirB3-like protein